MTIRGFLQNPLWQYFGWLPRILLQRIFDPEHLASLVSISVQETGDQIVFDFGTPPNVRVYLKVDNRSPLRVELDRLIIQLWHNGHTSELFNVDRIPICAGGTKAILVQGLHGVRYAHIDRTSLLSLNIRAYFNSRVVPFKVERNRIEGIHVTLVNIQNRPAP